MKDMVDRLIKCGFIPLNAISIVEKYYAEGNETGLQRFVEFSEKLYEEGREQ